MLKINLADEKRKAGQGPAGKPVEPDAANKDVTERRDYSESRRRNLLMPVAVLLVLAALLVFVWTQWEGIMGFFIAETPPPVEPQVSAPPPEPEPEPASAPVMEPDPVFVVINDVSAALPPRVWLSQFVATYDGAYEIKGIAFEHGSMLTFAAELDSLGTVTDNIIPEPSSSAEAVYTFSLTGAIDDFRAPDILDIIPADMLAAQCRAVRENSGEYDVEFTRFPDPDARYTGLDLPFELVGSYEGLKQVIAELCPEDGTNRVYRLVVRPASPGRVFDRVRAAFAIRRISSI